MKSIQQVLHLGCGNNKIAGSISIDILKNSQADIIHNLDKFPYPLKSNTFSKVVAENILEHLENLPKVMEEIHRVSKNKARVFVTTSHFTSVDSFTDPTHKHFFTSRSFDYFIEGEDLYKYKYSKAKFKKINVKLGPLDTKNFLINFILKLINKNIVFYEKRLAFIFPVGVIHYELEADKTKNGEN